MMKSNNIKGSLVAKNIIYGFGSKFIILILGVVIPRIVIISYGSEINGFLSTITQIFTYFALLEAGIGNATINALYIPIEKQNYDDINIVVSQAKKYYHKATIIYMIVVVAFAIIYPFVMSSDLDKVLMIKVILIQGVPNAISYYFCAVYEQLLMADGKRYISENIQLILHIFTFVMKIVLILNGFNVVIVQLAFFIITLIKIPTIILYCKYRYPWLSFSEEGNKNVLSERGAFVVHEVSATIFSNTDVFVVSVFCGFEAASIYTVYNMIFSSLNSLLNTANGGLGFILGQNLNKPLDNLRKIFDVYSIIYIYIYFVIMTSATIFSIPFVKLYTHGINDVNYVIDWIPVLFGVISVMSGARAIPARLITVSGHAKNTQIRSLVEMIINLLCSIILVMYFDIYGVLMGTIIALMYRMNDIIIYANKKILKRSSKKTYICLAIYFLIFFSVIYVAKDIQKYIHSFAGFLGYGVISVIVLLMFFLIPIFLVKKNILIEVLKNIYMKCKK